MQNSNHTAPGAQTRPPSLVPGLAFLAIGALLAGVAQRPGFPGAIVYYLAGALFVTAAGFLASAIVSLSEHDGSWRDGLRQRRRKTATPTSSRAYRRLLAGAARAGDAISVESLAIAGTLVVSSIGILMLLRGWRISEPIPALLRAPAAGVLIALVFPILVLERHFARVPPRFSDSPVLARLCRVPMFALLGLGIGALLGWLDFADTARLVDHGVAIVIGLIGVELALRGIVWWFSPRVPISQRRSHADSAIAGLLRLQRPDCASLSAGASRRFGIDLTRSWALRFIRRATAPALLVLALFGWLLTGLSALGPSERAVYESFGTPAGVFQPGLHIHLPWPLGVLRPVEFGTVHEIPVVFAADDGTPAEAAVPTGPAAADIEGPAPVGADRLWDASHPSEASYLVANNSNGRENFEVINIDLRVSFRIGLSDEAAREVTYNVASPESVIQAAAGRMLARYFARYTLLDILGQNRAAFIRGFQQELQARLAGLSTGIEIMGVVVEAIHPPPAAATAYQGVQTAAIRSVVQIAEAKAEAIQAINSAQSDATLLRNDALAAAAERLDLAKTELALFDGDRQAFSAGGRAFLFERRLQHFDKALKGVPFTVVDHRIEKTDAPVLDLRPLSGSAGSSIPPND